MRRLTASARFRTFSKEAPYMEGTMLVKRDERPFDGGRIIMLLWDDCPDAAPDKESYFFPGYLQIFIFGTGENPAFGLGCWQTIFACPKDKLIGISEFDNGFLLVEFQKGSGFINIEVGEAKLRNPDSPKQPSALVDFELPNGDMLTYAFVLMDDGVVVEIPNETLH